MRALANHQQTPTTMGGGGRGRQQGAVAVLLLWIAVRGAVEGAKSSMILSSVGNADSRFNNQSFVRAAGYTHMAASNLQLCLSYRWLSPAIFPNGSDAEAWRAKCVKTAQKEIDAAHAQGLKVSTSSRPIVLRKTGVNQCNPMRHLSSHSRFGVCMRPFVA